MTNHDLHDNDALRQLLRAETDGPPYEQVDWMRLHARITAGAAPLLRRRTAPWWQQIAAWSPRGIPAALAAAALVVLLLGDVSRPVPAASAAAGDFRIIEEELADAAPFLSTGTDAVVDALLFDEVEQ